MATILNYTANFLNTSLFNSNALVGLSAGYGVSGLYGVGVHTGLVQAFTINVSKAYIADPINKYINDRTQCHDYNANLVHRYQTEQVSHIQYQNEQGAEKVFSTEVADTLKKN